MCFRSTSAKPAASARPEQIAEFAQSVGIKCTIGSNLELGVGSAAMIHLALSAPGIDAETYPCDIIGPLFYEDDVLTEPLPIIGGSARATRSARVRRRTRRRKGREVSRAVSDVAAVDAGC